MTHQLEQQILEVFADEVAEVQHIFWPQGVFSAERAEDFLIEYQKIMNQYYAWINTEANCSNVKITAERLDGSDIKLRIQVTDNFSQHVVHQLQGYKAS